MEIFQNEPMLVLELLQRAGVAIRWRSGVSAAIADSNLSDREPDEVKSMFADNVFVYECGQARIAVVAEVQTGRPGRERSLKWPAYAANARARHGCRTYLLVFATTRDAARGSAKTIRMGHPGWDLAPLLTGIGLTPGTPAQGGRYAPELTLLRIITGDLQLDTHDARMFALAALKLAPPERRERYTRYIRKLAPPQARNPLESLMKTMWRDDFVDGLLDQGRAEASRQKLLQVLARRLSVSEDIRQRVEGCTDMATLDRWFDRAIDAGTVEEVFAELRAEGHWHGVSHPGGRAGRWPCR